MSQKGGVKISRPKTLRQHKTSFLLTQYTLYFEKSKGYKIKKFGQS